MSVDRDTFYKVIGFKSPSIPVVAKEATSHEASCPSSPNKERTAMTSKVQLPFIPKSDGKVSEGADTNCCKPKYFSGHNIITFR